MTGWAGRRRAGRGTGPAERRPAVGADPGVASSRASARTSDTVCPVAHGADQVFHQILQRHDRDDGTVRSVTSAR